MIEIRSIGHMTNEAVLDKVNERRTMINGIIIIKARLIGCFFKV